MSFIRWTWYVSLLLSSLTGIEYYSRYLGGWRDTSAELDAGIVRSRVEVGHDARAPHQHVSDASDEWSVRRNGSGHQSRKIDWFQAWFFHSSSFLIISDVWFRKLLNDLIIFSHNLYIFSIFLYLILILVLQLENKMQSHLHAFLKKIRMHWIVIPLKPARSL